MKMKIKHQAPHLDKVIYFDVADRKSVVSYDATYKRKIRYLRKKQSIEI